MRYDLHGLTIHFESRDQLLRERFAASFASRPRTESAPDLNFTLDMIEQIPAPPARIPDYAERDLIHYYVDGQQVLAHFPRYGRLQLYLERGRIEGAIVSSAITTYGVLEDLIAIGLSPFLRRRGRFLIHAFAAARHNRAALLVGGIGAGKTTTGIALLRAGWQLLSNDAPLIDQETTDVLSYPGLLSAYADTLTRFPELAPLASTPGERRKITFDAVAIYPEVWSERAAPGVILFPRVANMREHQVERLAPPEALRLLLPHAVERWDTEMIPAHLALLNRLVARAPAYKLSLAPDVETIPALVEALLVKG